MASKAFQRALNEEIKPHGITWRQCEVLAYLALAGPLAQAELAERMGIEPPTLVRILDRMQRDGFIFRKLCPEDRRKKLVTPAPAAQPVWSKIAECAKRVRSQAIRGLSPTEVTQLKRMLHTVEQNLNRNVVEEVA